MGDAWVAFVLRAEGPVEAMTGGGEEEQKLVNVVWREKNKQSSNCSLYCSPWKNNAIQERKKKDYSKEINEKSSSYFSSNDIDELKQSKGYNR